MYIGVQNPFQDGIVAKEDFKFGIFVISHKGDKFIGKPWNKL